MKKLILTIVTLLALGACTKEETIAGKKFALMPEKSFTILFDKSGNRFSGQALNNYFGEYKIEKNNLTLTVQGATMMAGSEEEMQKEMEYFQNLGKISAYTYKDKTLTLTGPDITLTYQEQ